MPSFEEIGNIFWQNIAPLYLVKIPPCQKLDRMLQRSNMCCEATAPYESDCATTGNNNTNFRWRWNGSSHRVSCDTFPDFFLFLSTQHFWQFMGGFAFIIHSCSSDKIFPAE